MEWLVGGVYGDLKRMKEMAVNLRGFWFIGNGLRDEVLECFI